jgi:hypothetical protein
MLSVSDFGAKRFIARRVSACPRAERKAQMRLILDRAIGFLGSSVQGDVELTNGDEVQASIGSIKQLAQLGRLDFHSSIHGAPSLSEIRFPGNTFFA